jgi:hypothetical protein
VKSPGGLRRCRCIGFVGHAIKLSRTAVVPDLKTGLKLLTE